MPQQPTPESVGGHERATPRWGERLTIILFIAVLWIPMLGWMTGFGTDRGASQFELDTPRPTWVWSPGAMLRYPREMQRQINRQFPFRDALMELHARMKIQVFGVTSSDRVTLGKDGWLFYAGERILENYRRLAPFSNEQLSRWRDLLVRRRDWLRAHGIPFLFFVAPDPQTIYPEYMPESLGRAPGPSRLDQLLAYLRAHSDLDVIDVRPVLLAAKQTIHVCYTTDSHWNQDAGFLVYQEIASWLRTRFPTMRTFTIADFERMRIPNWHGGLSYFLGAPWLFSETREELRPRIPARILTDGKPLPFDETTDAWVRRRVVVRESDDGEISSAVILRDSQFAAPAQFLSRHFRRSVLTWRQVLDPQLIETERPSVVIEEIAERFLMEDVPEDPPLP